MNYERIAGAMKSLMTTSVILIVIGLVFKLQHWPNGNLIFWIGSFAFPIFSGINTIVTMQIIKRIGEKPIRPLISTAYLISAAAVLIGAFSKLQHYPHGTLLILAGSIAGTIVCLVDGSQLRKIIKESVEQKRSR
jgi:phosphate/sulfate permease